MSDKIVSHAYDTLIRYIAHPPNPDFEPTEEQASQMIHELANEFTDYISDVIKAEDITVEQAIGMRRACVLFHQMLMEARRAA